jgi:NRPS condensation-like uncharacterized protein
VPLSFAQQRLWFLDQLGEKGALYHVPLIVKIKGELNISALSKSLNTILARHEALRTTFPMLSDSPVQKVNSVSSVPLSISDLRGSKNAEEEAVTHINANVRKPFDVSKDLMLRTALYRLSDTEWIFAVVFHHIAADGWSLDLFCSELSQLYNAIAKGKHPVLSELPIQYRDYSCWQQKEARSGKLDRQLSYWKQQLAGSQELIELPTWQPRPAAQGHRGSCLSAELSSELTRKLKDFAEREHVTPFMVMLAAFKILIMRYSQEHDIAIGTAVAGRRRYETEKLIGCFVNTLVLRTNLSGEPSFKEVVHRVRDVALGAYANQS